MASRPRIAYDVVVSSHTLDMVVSAALSAGRPIPLPPPGAPGPFAFGHPDTARAVLTAAGFGSIEVHALTKPMGSATAPTTRAHSS